jgi:hypothetical protein
MSAKVTRGQQPAGDLCSMTSGQLDATCAQELGDKSWAAYIVGCLLVLARDGPHAATVSAQLTSNGVSILLDSRVPEVGVVKGGPNLSACTSFADSLVDLPLSRSSGVALSRAGRARPTRKEDRALLMLARGKPSHKSVHGATRSRTGGRWLSGQGRVELCGCGGGYHDGAVRRAGRAPRGPAGARPARHTGVAQPRAG